MTRPRRAMAASGAAAAVFGVALVGWLVLGPSAMAGAASQPPQPFHVEASSVIQDGQAIVWQLQLTESFSPGALAHDHRALCLLIERSRSGVVAGEVCITGPARRSGQPRLVYMTISDNTSGPPRPIEATISRGDSRELTASFLPSAVGLEYEAFRWQVISSARGAACAPPSPQGGSCFELYPAKPTLLVLHTPVLAGCVPSGPSLVSHGPSQGREIALTFDDGPWADPPAMDFLRLLEREHVPATFFEIGRQISAYDPGGEAERRMLADGDMIGDHTWSHPNMAALPPTGQRAQLADTVDAIRRATGGFTPCLWRPPYGAVSPSLVKAARALGLLTIMWNVDPRDWALPGVSAIYSNVVTNARPGAIVIQHFGGGPRYQTLEALPHEITTLRRRGYRFVTVAQLLDLKLVYR